MEWIFYLFSVFSLGNQRTKIYKFTRVCNTNNKRPWNPDDYDGDYDNDHDDDDAHNGDTSKTLMKMSPHIHVQQFQGHITLQTELIRPKMYVENI